MKNLRCPICDHEMDSASEREAALRPFCSERCRLIDLGRWLSGRYRLEDTTPDEDVGELEAESDPS